MVALVLKPQRDGKDKFYPPSTKSPDNVSLMVHFLIDINVSNLHDCQHNREELSRLKEHLLTYESTLRSVMPRPALLLPLPSHRSEPDLMSPRPTSCLTPP